MDREKPQRRKSLKIFAGKFFKKDLFYVKGEKGKISVFSLTFPIFLEGITSQLLGIVQAAMSAYFLDGFFVIPINYVNTVMGFFNALLLTPVMGVSILLSAHLGKGDKEACKKIVGNALVLHLICSALFCIPGIFAAEGILGKIMGMDKAEYAEYLPYAVEYLRFRLVFLFALQWYAVLTMALRCYGYSSAGFICALTANVVNSAITALMLFVVGVEKEAAIGTFLRINFAASAVAVIIAVWIFIKKGVGINLKPEFIRIKGLLRVGVPSSVFSVAYSLSQVFTTSICTAYLVPSAVKAKLYASQILAFVYQFGYAMGKANGIMVGRECGEGNFKRAREITSQNRIIVIICNATLSVFIALLCRPLMSLFFNADEQTVSYAYAVFWIDVAVELGRAFGHVGEGGLNATGDVVFMSSVAVFSCWIFSVGLAYLFVGVFSMGLAGVWLAFAADEITRGLCYYLRWRSGKWEKSFKRKIIARED